MKVRTPARREAILEAARKVFLEIGYERASMSEIARRVGGSKATLYSYFPCKATLFVAAAHAEGRRVLEASTRELEHSAAEDLHAALLSLGTDLVGFLSSAKTVAAHRMILAEAGRSDIGHAFYEQGPLIGITRLADTLHAAMRRGELREADPLVAAHHLHSLLSAELQPMWYEQTVPALPPDRCKAIAQNAVDVFMRGYRA
ncbi:transcriptional regulator [Rubrivivax gelatinosus]|nr:transcriptional regulator [Rubrivivax gelatinosus]